MIKVYSMESCPDCINVHSQVKDNDNFEIIDIGKDVRNLKEFIRLRDNNKTFDECKANGSIGIPCFVKEDGIVWVKNIKSCSPFYLVKVATSNNSDNNTNTSTDSSSTSTTKVVTCEDENGKGWVWSESKKACVYKVTNTGAK